MTRLGSGLPIKYQFYNLYLDLLTGVLLKIGMPVANVKAAIEPIREIYVVIILKFRLVAK